MDERTSKAIDDYARSGIVVSSTARQHFEDDSTLWVFKLQGDDDEYTARLCDTLRHPVEKDRVLVLLLAGYKNHAKEVVYDADLRALARMADEKHLSDRALAISDLKEDLARFSPERFQLSLKRRVSEYESQRPTIYILTILEIAKKFGTPECLLVEK